MKLNRGIYSSFYVVLLIVGNYCLLLYRILQAPSNNISKILLSNQTISNLNEVNLSKNPISEWSDVLNLSALLPNLQILALNECSIKNIEFGALPYCKFTTTLPMVSSMLYMFELEKGTIDKKYVEY